MKQLKYITPEFFHNWLNDCPVKWERIEDNVDEISSDLDLELVDLNDIEIYQILLQMNRFTGGK